MNPAYADKPFSIQGAMVGVCVWALDELDAMQRLARMFGFDKRCVEEEKVLSHSGGMRAFWVGRVGEVKHLFHVRRTVG